MVAAFWLQDGFSNLIFSHLTYLLLFIVADVSWLEDGLADVLSIIIHYSPWNVIHKISVVCIASSAVQDPYLGKLMFIRPLEGLL